MAIIIEGRSKCKICGNTMNSKENLIAFPRFVINENDPLYFFYGEVFHKECFFNHSQKNILIEKFLVHDKKHISLKMNKISTNKLW